MNDKVAVVGTTTWGTTLGVILAQKGIPVTLLARTPEEAEGLNSCRQHARRLPGVVFPRGLKITSVVARAVASTRLVILAVPPSQAQRGGDPAPNDRCGPKGVNPGCAMTGAELVPQATTPGTQSRTCYDFDTTATTAGPFGTDVVGGFVNDVWFRLAAPHCPGKRVVVNAAGSTYAVSMFLLSEGGGLPFFVCDVTCDAIAGNSFFDSDFVIALGDAVNFTVGPAIAGRDLYFLVNGGGSGALRFCVTTACP